MPVPPVWTDNSTSVTAANLNNMTAADTTEAATNAALSGSATWQDNLARIRAAISLIVAGNTTTGMATLLTNAVQMLPLSQKGVLNGVCDLDGSVHVPLTRLSGVTTTQLSATAAIAGTQLAAGANIAGSQLAAAAAISAGQIASVNPTALTGTGTIPAAAMATATPGAFAVGGALSATGHISATGSTPTITQPTSGSSSISGNDQRGRLTYATGGTPGVGLAFQVTFATAYASTPTVVLTTEYDSGNATSFQVGAVSTTGFAIYNHAAPAASQTFNIQYQVIG